MPAFKGFNAGEKQIVQKAARDAKVCIKAALNEAFLDNDAFQMRATRFFSDKEPSGGWSYVTTLIMKTVSSMKLAVESDLYKVVKGVQAAAPTSNAAACSWMQITAVNKKEPSWFQGTMIHLGIRKNVLEAQMDQAKANGASAMSIYPLFFKLPYRSETGQNQVQSFLHELSHVAAGTVDIDAPRCYGNLGVAYCMNAGKSAQNAENVSMFLVTYLP